MSPAALHRVLIVDDEQSIRFAMQDYLVARHYAVDCASDPAEAVARLARASYDVVLVDLRLTATDDDGGLDVVGFVRAHAPRTRTILMTAYGSPAIELEARRRGADVVLQKPQPLSEIARIVEGLLAAPGGP